MSPETARICPSAAPQRNDLLGSGSQQVGLDFADMNAALLCDGIDECLERIGRGRPTRRKEGLEVTLTQSSLVCKVWHEIPHSAKEGQT